MICERSVSLFIRRDIVSEDWNAVFVVVSISIEELPVTFNGSDILDSDGECGEILSGVFAIVVKLKGVEILNDVASVRNKAAEAEKNVLVIGVRDLIDENISEALIAADGVKFAIIGIVVEGNEVIPVSAVIIAEINEDVNLLEWDTPKGYEDIGFENDEYCTKYEKYEVAFINEDVELAKADVTTVVSAVVSGGTVTEYNVSFVISEKYGSVMIEDVVALKECDTELFIIDISYEENWVASVCAEILFKIYETNVLFEMLGVMLARVEVANEEIAFFENVVTFNIVPSALLEGLIWVLGLNEADAISKNDSISFNIDVVFSGTATIVKAFDFG